MNYTELVKELNIELHEKFEEEEKMFSYQTNGFDDAILFDGVLLWNSEIDGREWIEEKNDYEPFESFIRRTFNEYLDKINSLRI